MQPTSAPPSLSLLARDELAASGGDTDAACEALTNKLLNDSSLLRAVISQALTDAVAYRVGHSMRAERATIVRQATRADVQALATGLAASLLDMPLAGGLKLRNATREQVQEQATMYESKASDMSRKARWLELIAQAVPHDRTVGDVISDARATELWNEVA